VHINEIRDGGKPTLTLSRKIEDAETLVVTDLRTLEAVAPEAYVAQAQSVRLRRGVWADGPNRWQVEHDVTGDDPAESDTGESE
jgi:hypothetical protein